MTQEYLSECSIPDPILAKLYDYTGTKDGANKGFILFFPNSKGSPYCVSRTDGMITKMALSETVKMYARSNGEIFEGDDEDFDFNDLDDIDDD